MANGDDNSRQYFIFNGVNSKDLGIVITGTGVFSRPVRSYATTYVPGKNGAVYTDNGYYENVDVQYTDCFFDVFDDSDMQEAFKQHWNSMNALFRTNGYCRLEDTYHPNYFRLGVLANSTDLSMEQQLRNGTFTITFNCKPQTFLKSGEQQTTITSSGTYLANPDSFIQYESKPLIRVYGTGELVVGGVTIKITNANEYTDIDSEIEECYRDAENCNANVTLTDHKFPTLDAQNGTGFTLGSGITKVEVTPRWYFI